MKDYFEILPLKKTGPESQTFTYEANEPLEPGLIVEIPLRKRLLRGLVMEKTTKPKYRTRKIKKILSQEPLLDETRIDLAKKISEYYYCSLGETINAFLPFDLGKKRQTPKTQKNPSAIREKPHKLTPRQEKTLEAIEKSRPGSKHLLHGVTGSGKTEIYLRLVAAALKKDQGSIILVPEIALTPQTKARFEARFGKKVAVWHSQLKETEKYRTWEEIRSGQKPVVLGARSAIFSPVKNLAHIIIDEEHESGYKQEQNPKYEAAKVAEWLSDSTGAKLILGTATPRLETFYKSQKKRYTYHLLNKRIIQKSMPPVSIVDMRDEFKKGNKSIFSDDLSASLSKTLKERNQALLFVNRRGASTFVVCRDCGRVEKCPHCEIPLVYHSSGSSRLRCHHCEFEKAIPETCPTCQSAAIKYFGLGTQKVEIEAKKAFPEAKIRRMDRDTTKKRDSHAEIYEDFKNKKFDILIGTQIIAKGWDLPDVNLVGIVAADTTLNIPDYQSAERTFSLLAQVAGRTGRDRHPGQVIIQTYAPETYAIQHAEKHDYLGFYEEELVSREKYSYPPFSSFVKLVFRSEKEEKAEERAHRLAEDLKKKESEKIRILGPAPSFIYRKRGRYHWQIIIKLVGEDRGPESDRRIVRFNQELKKIVPPDWTVDVSPANLL